uniref:Uncharacterized protein n=1 Tax=viral metagenome TaxID=1070528 RepID=A0A6M3IXN4_9ZZZZ
MECGKEYTVPCYDIWLHTQETGHNKWELVWKLEAQMNNEAKLTQGEIDKAWEDAFEEPVEFDHKPTAEEVFNYRLEVVADTASEKAIKYFIEWGEEVCPHWQGEQPRWKHTCILCWQSLKAGEMP